MSLRQFTILSKDGKEKNALAHAYIIEKYQRNCGFVEAIFSKKQRLEEKNGKLCVTCITHVKKSSLETLQLNSPYSKLLRQRKLMGLAIGICNLLNKGSELYLQIKFFSAKLFSGSIWYNTNDGQAVMAHMAEAHGQSKIVNSHCESFGMIRARHRTHSSFHPSIIKLYPDIWSVSLYHSDG